MVNLKKLFLILVHCTWSNCNYENSRHGFESIPLGSTNYHRDGGIPFGTLINDQFATFYETPSFSEENNTYQTRNVAPSRYSQSHYPSPCERLKPQVGSQNQPSYHHLNDPSASSSFSNDLIYQTGSAEAPRDYPSTLPTDDPSSNHVQNFYFVNDPLAQGQIHPPSHLVKSNYHTTATEPSDAILKKHYPFDLSNVPDLPFYFAAMSKFPYRSNYVEKIKGINQKVDKIMQAAMLTSGFDTKYQPRDLSEIEVNQLTFMENLCLKSISFLLTMHEKLDKKISEELAEMLAWLNEESNLHIANKISEHLKNQLQPHQKKLNIPGYEKKIEISEYAAKEAKLIIEILLNYYKTKNRDKWDILIRWDSSFFKFYWKMGLNYPTGQSKHIMKNHWDDIRASEIGIQTLLPWSRPLELSQKSPMPMKMFENIQLTEDIKNRCKNGDANFKEELNRWFKFNKLKLAPIVRLQDIQSKRIMH